MRFLVLEDYREMALCFLFSVPAASIGANNAQTQRTPIAIDPMTRIWPSSESPITPGIIRGAKASQARGGLTCQIINR